MTRRAVILVLDGVGGGAAHDAADYGDSGSDTIGNVAHALGGLDLPALQQLGLGHACPRSGLRSPLPATGAWGRMQPASAGKDSTTGHWEIAGLRLVTPFPTFPDGFPDAVLSRFSEATGRGVLGNVAASGTEILDRLGEKHMRTGDWIVYTSADSVFQVAAHMDVVPPEHLYAACETARALLVTPFGVSRVIARPFAGEPGAWYRVSEQRRDFSLAPPGETLLDVLAEARIERAGIGKVDDLFAGRHLRSTHTVSNAEGLRAIGGWLEGPSVGLLFANLVDFDQLYGHRNDVQGFYGALREFDAALPSLLHALREDDLLLITADHGNDPTTPSTDHSREAVPLLVAGKRVRAVALGERRTFADVGASVAEWFGLGWRGTGTSFLPDCVAP